MLEHEPKDHPEEGNEDGSDSVDEDAVLVGVFLGNSELHKSAIKGEEAFRGISNARESLEDSLDVVRPRHVELPHDRKDLEVICNDPNQDCLGLVPLRVL